MLGPVFTVRSRNKQIHLFGTRRIVEAKWFSNEIFDKLLWHAISCEMCASQPVGGRCESVRAALVSCDGFHSNSAGDVSVVSAEEQTVS